MSDTLKELEGQVRSLTTEERVAAYDRGELKTFSAEDVFAEARRLARGAARGSSPHLQA